MLAMSFCLLPRSLATCSLCISMNAFSCAVMCAWVLTHGKTSKSSTAVKTVATAKAIVFWSLFCWSAKAKWWWRLHFASGSRLLSPPTAPLQLQSKGHDWCWGSSSCARRCDSPFRQRRFWAWLSAARMRHPSCWSCPELLHNDEKHYSVHLRSQPLMLTTAIVPATWFSTDHIWAAYQSGRMHHMITDM